MSELESKKMCLLKIIEKLSTKVGGDKLLNLVQDVLDPPQEQGASEITLEDILLTGSLTKVGSDEYPTYTLKYNLIISTTQTLNIISGQIFKLDGHEIINNGTINNNGRIMNEMDGIMRNYGTINNFDRMESNNVWFYNYGTINNTSEDFDFTNSDMNNNGKINNESGAIININDGTKINNYGTIDNRGTIKIAGSYAIEWSKINNFTGGIINNSGTIDNDTDGEINNYDGGTIDNSGTINNEGGGRTNNFGNTSGVGPVDNVSAVVGGLNWGGMQESWRRV